MNSNHIGMKPHVNHGSMESLSSSSGNFSSGLTIHQYRSKLMNIIENEPIFVLIGATGSGKTTQIPQWCLQSKHSTGDPEGSLSQKCRTIGITQPRRVAAVSIATRVANEMKTPLGQLVGYSVRFDEVISPSTRIKFMTDGMLLRESLYDPMLRKYSFLILDEAHERSIQTDILFAIVKKAYQSRKKNGLSSLRVIIMSATMNVDKFSQYFDQCPVYKIAGRHHPIEILHSEKDLTDTIHSTLVTVFQIHRTQPPGDILVFCTGQEEIENMVAITRDTCFQLPPEQRNLVPLPLYAALPFNVQFKIFKTFTGKRKVIFATNIAETSITISGIKYVVDCGKFKCRRYKPSSGMDTLKIETISQAQAWQRAGRAGRESSGTCYRLYTRESYENMPKEMVPEMLRCNLASVLLHLAAIGIKDFTKFDFMDKPTVENINKSTELLISLGSITKDENNLYQITNLGRQMVNFPLDPRLAKILIASSELGCSDEILSVISILSVENVFHIPSHKKDEAAEVHKKFRTNEGDHIMLLKLYRAYKSAKGSKDWCKENYIDFRNMRMVANIRQQMASLYERSNFTKNSCGSNTELVRKCLTLGLYHNVALIGKDGDYRSKMSEEKVYIHPSSCLFNLKPEYVIYSELVQTSKCYMRNISVIDYNWLKLL
ncbi:ATP-dependent RNA helicase DHX33-like [Panonychus citri]|uniref:ATP-dependent RNA helicase DHX33-like n=1 Tax=Panonychus citri TaxID=50023 RepID=UPI002306FEF5|nr:ATP-dependent RNA helicase DHX33-like [Panonychus citri]